MPKEASTIFSRRLPTLAKFMIQKTIMLTDYLHWKITGTSTMPLQHWGFETMKWTEKGVALVMAFFTRHDEKQDINQSKVNWRWFLILNQPIEINMQSGNIF